MTLSEENKKQANAQRFGLYLGLASIAMLFTALTSAFLVRQGAGNWLFVNLPIQFWISTVVIILSSITFYYAKAAHASANISQYRLLIWTTFILGIAFILLQYMGWLAMANTGVYLDGNPGGSFIYVISMVHVVHVVLGLVLLAIVSIRTTIKSHNPDHLHKIGLMATYWHFVDFLWIYLFIFFQIKFF